MTGPPEGRRGRRFERSMFVALLAVALIPTTLVVAAGAWALGDTLQRAGSAGPWETVSASGNELADRVEESWPEGDPLPADVAEAVAAHREALAGSAEMSRLYAAVSARALNRLPLLVAVLGLFVALLAWIAARLLARGFARPVGELVEWTGRIARDEPLPADGEAQTGVEELDVLGHALHKLASQVVEGRARAVEAARLATWSAAARRVAHEIKNPLTPMKIAARQLRDSAPTDAAESSADILLEEIDRLDGLARTFSQVGAAPEGPPAPIDVVELVHELVAPLTEGATAVQVRVEGTPALVAGHLDALRSAIRNVVINAIEACESGGAEPSGEPPVTVTVATAQGLDGQAGVEVIVEDQGPGIPDGVAGSLWNLDVTTKRRGSGIGLSVVRNTVLAHHGTVHAENRSAGGARFSLWLPSADVDRPD